MVNILPLASSSRGNAYYISDGIAPILLDAGISYREIQKGLNFRTSQLEGCLISHEHGDHVKAVKDLLRIGIDVYMSQGTKEALDIDSHRIKIIKEKKQFEVGSWKILPFDLQHDANEPVGFLLQNKAKDKLLYATDTMYIKYQFEGLTHILIECNHSRKILDENVKKNKISSQMKKRVISSHFGLEQVKEFLKANDLSKVKEIHLLHLSDNNSNAKQFKREIQGLTGKMVFVASK